jgi:phosphohistidine swiveling domain-containing protein
MNTSNNKSKENLTLLGVWNILPLGVWTWHNDLSIDQLERLTGKRLRNFCYIKDDLNYECLIQKDTDALKYDLDQLSLTEQQKYVQKITDDYYEKVKRLEEQLDIAESQNISSINNEELALVIKNLAEAWSKVTIQIWYALLLDIWYPRPDDKLSIKNVIAKPRDHCGNLHARSDKIEHKMYLEAANRLNLTKREIYFLIQPEIASMLRGKEISKEEISSRIKLWVGSNYHGKWQSYGEKEAEEIMRLFVIPKIGEKKEGDLKGTPASRGKVQGRAHVILLDKDFPDFKEGEILVSLQTMVHYLPIMKKSKAILTEFGGLTSHAAIVSRELGKPSVVGISGLISTIKTGDTLEIDATKGIVRKLS